MAAIVQSRLATIPRIVADGRGGKNIKNIWGTVSDVHSLDKRYFYRGKNMAQ